MWIWERSPTIISSPLSLQWTITERERKRENEGNMSVHYCWILLQHLVTNKNKIPWIVLFLWAKAQISIIFEISDFNSQRLLLCSDTGHSHSKIRVYFTSKLLPSDNCKQVLLIALGTIVQSHLQSGYPWFLWGQTELLPYQTYQQLFSAVL